MIVRDKIMLIVKFRVCINKEVKLTLCSGCWSSVLYKTGFVNANNS